MGFAPNGLSTPLEISELGLQPDSRMALQFQPLHSLLSEEDIAINHSPCPTLQPAGTASDQPKSQALVFCKPLSVCVHGGNWAGLIIPLGL